MRTSSEISKRIPEKILEEIPKSILGANSGRIFRKIPGKIYAGAHEGVLEGLRESLYEFLLEFLEEFLLKPPREIAQESPEISLIFCIASGTSKWIQSLISRKEFIEQYELEYLYEFFKENPGRISH